MGVANSDTEAAPVAIADAPDDGDRGCESVPHGVALALGGGESDTAGVKDADGASDCVAGDAEGVPDASRDGVPAPVGTKDMMGVGDAVRDGVRESAPERETDGHGDAERDAEEVCDADGDLDTAGLEDAHTLPVGDCALEREADAHDDADSDGVAGGLGDASAVAVGDSAPV